MPIIFSERQTLIMKTRDAEISFPNENEHSPCHILLFDSNKINAIENRYILKVTIEYFLSTERFSVPL